MNSTMPLPLVTYTTSLETPCGRLVIRLRPFARDTALARDCANKHALTDKRRFEI